MLNILSVEFKVFSCVLDLPRGEPLRLHGEHFSGGQDQLLREARGRIPEDGRDVEALNTPRRDPLRTSETQRETN